VSAKLGYRRRPEGKKTETAKNKIDNLIFLPAYTRLEKKSNETCEIHEVHNAPEFIVHTQPTLWKEKKTKRHLDRLNVEK
jgi:hypothetical protein